MKQRTVMTHLMLERITFIHKKIASGCYPCVKDLAYSTEVSIATINRDIAFMKDRMDAPIKYDASQRGFYYSEEFDMPVYSLSEHDAQMIAAARLLLSFFKNTPIYEEADGIIDLLSSSVIKGSATNLKGRITLAPSAKSIIPEQIWKDICSAMENNKIVEFDYVGRWKDEQTHRKVHPYQIVLDDGDCFLFGWSEERNAERLFSLRRISNLLITDETYKLPDNIDFTSRCGGGKFGAFTGGKKERCTIRFYSSARNMVKGCCWADDQVLTDGIEDGEPYTDITFTSSQTGKVLEWALSQGYNAYPMEPEWMFKRWKENAQWMAEV